MTELKASLETIQITAKELITEIEGHFTELQQQRQAEQEQGDVYKRQDKCVAGSVNTACPVCSVNMSECAGVELSLIHI